jgi:Ulp1 family protease
MEEVQVNAAATDNDEVIMFDAPVGYVAGQQVRRRVKKSRQGTRRTETGQVWTYVNQDGLIVDLLRWSTYSFDCGDMETLAPGAWMNSQAVTLFAILYCQEAPLVEIIGVHDYTHFKYNMDMYNTATVIHGDEECERYQARQIWVAIINLGNFHWQCLVIVNPGTHHSVSFLLDSMVQVRGQKPSNYDSVEQFANAYIYRVFGVSEPARMIPTHMRPSLVPYQPNPYDCGPFTLMNIKNVASRAAQLVELLPAELDHVFDFRNWYAAREAVASRRVLYNRFQELLLR